MMLVEEPTRRRALAQARTAAMPRAASFILTKTVDPRRQRRSEEEYCTRSARVSLRTILPNGGEILRSQALDRGFRGGLLGR
jgi:hypothetical protein